MSNSSNEADLRVTGQGRQEWLNPLRFGLLLAVLFLVSYPGIVLGTQTFFYRDYGVLGFPFIHYSRECFWRGELPLWNPLSHCGVPFLAQWGTMTLYPLSLIYLLLPLPWSLGVFSLGHLWLGGLGMFLLARRWMGGGLGPAVAGVAFAFSGLSQSCLMWPNYTVALGWMPWLILLVEKAWRVGGRHLVVAAFVGALQMLSGVPEIILMTWGVLGLMAVGQTTRRDFRFVNWQRFVVIVLLVAGLSAAQLLPFFELLEHSQRQGGVSATKWSMPLWGWANLVLPSFHYFRTTQGTLVQEGQNFFGSYYPGLVVVALAGLAVWRVRRRMVWLLAVVCLAGLVMAWGDAFAPNRWLREWLPFAGFARYPVKFVTLAAFAFPLLAGFAVQWFSKEASYSESDFDSNLKGRSLASSSFHVVTGITLLLMLGLVLSELNHLETEVLNMLKQSFWSRAIILLLVSWCLRVIVSRSNFSHRLLFSCFLIGALWLDLRTHLPNLNPTLPGAVMTPGYAVAESDLKTAPKLGEGRVFITPQAEKLLLRSSVADLGQDFIGKRFAQWSNLNVLDGVPKVNGAATLRVWEQDQVQEWLYANATNTPPRLLDFLGATHQSAPDNPTGWVKRAQPMPWVTAGQRAMFADAAETKRRMLAEDFAPEREVLLPIEASGAVQATKVVGARVVQVKFEADNIGARVESAEPTMLVIAQTWYPAWEASVDGQPTRLWRANHAFMAIEVPAGAHRVELRYRDRAFQKGAWIGLATLAVCLGIIARTRKRAVKS